MLCLEFSSLWSVGYTLFSLFFPFYSLVRTPQIYLTTFLEEWVADRFVLHTCESLQPLGWPGMVQNVTRSLQCSNLHWKLTSLSFFDHTYKRIEKNSVNVSSRSSPTSEQAKEAQKASDCNETFQFPNPNSLIWDSEKLKTALLCTLARSLHIRISINQVKISKLCMKFNRTYLFLRSNLRFTDAVQSSLCCLVLFNNLLKVETSELRLSETHQWSYMWYAWA